MKKSNEIKCWGTRLKKKSRKGKEYRNQNNMDQKWIKKTNALKSEWTKWQINNNQEKHKT